MIMRLKNLIFSKADSTSKRERIPTDWARNGSIEFDSISMKYESSPEPVLRYCDQSVF
jgi:hypothetical protein